LFVFLGNIAIKPATSFLYGRCGFRAMLVASTAGMAATMVAAAFIRSSTPVAVIAGVLLLSGIARSIGGTGYMTIAFTDVPDEQLRDANTLQATVQQLAMGFGVAVATIALQAGHPLARLFIGDGKLVSAYAVAFILLALLSLVATAAALRLHPSAGNVLRGGRGTRERGGRQPATTEEATAGP
jgi:hypothetical protein